MHHLPYRPVDQKTSFPHLPFKNVRPCLDCCGFLVSRFQTMVLPYLRLAPDTNRLSLFCLFHVPSPYYMSDVRLKYHNLSPTCGPDGQALPYTMRSHEIAPTQAGRMACSSLRVSVSSEPPLPMFTQMYFPRTSAFSAMGSHPHERSSQGTRSADGIWTRLRVDSGSFRTSIPRSLPLFHTWECDPMTETGNLWWDDTVFCASVCS